MVLSKNWLYGGLILGAGFAVMRLASAPRLRRGMRVLLVGDSLAVGMAPHFAVLAKEAGIQLEVLAIVGTRIDQWAQSAKLTEKLAAFKPELVLVSLGTNDEYMGGDAVARQRPFLEQLLAKLEEHADVVWIGPPTLPRATNGIVALIQGAAGNVLAPRFTYFHSERLQIPRGPDKLHPTPVGYAGWAGAIWHWLS